MRKPRATSAGPVNAGQKVCKSLGGDKQISTATGSAAQRQFRLALRLDRSADFLLQQGFHHQAEHLANRAAELRQGVAR
jgi:hypothetical protein